MTNRSKVLIVYDAILEGSGSERTIGGIQTYLLALASVIREMGLSVKILQESTVDFERELDGIPIIGRRVTNRNPDKKYLELVNLVRAEFPPEETLIIWGSYHYAPSQTDYSAIAIQHGVAFDLIQASRRNNVLIKIGLSRIIKYLQRTTAYRRFRKVEYRVCVDYNYLNWYRTMSSREDEARISVIPNFTNIPDWPVEEKATFRKILFARRFVEKRGLSVFLQVSRRLLAQFPDIEITFAGAGPGLSRVEELQSEYPDRVTIMCYEPSDSLSFHRNFDIAVIPTIGSEGTSLSLLEAMAAGCAVVCSNVGGITNIVIDQYNGVMVHPESNEFYQAIVNLRENPTHTNRLRLAARNTVENGFSIDLWEGKWAKLIKKLVGAN